MSSRENQSSSGTYTQENHPLKVFTSLQENELLLRSFTGHEGISQLFSFQLDLISQNHSINFNDIVGQEVSFCVQLAEQEDYRYFNGFVSRFIQLADDGRFARYQAEVVPWLWFLTRTSDCRVFQNKSVPDIVQEVFTRFGFQDFENRLQGTYEPWDYCVQYRETAFNFVMRLLEQEGIFFFFRHEQENHVLVLGDAPSAFKPCPGQSKIRFDPTAASSGDSYDEVITNWQHEEGMRTGAYTVNDFNFETPNTDLTATISSTVRQGGNDRFEVYDYPGEYDKKSEGDDYARKRIEEEEAPHLVVSGSTNCRSLAVGFKFEADEMRRRDQNGSYAVTTLSHSAHGGGVHESGEEEKAHYSNLFKAIPTSVKFRPMRVTPKPLMQGVQTAFVTGPSGEEIYTDKYGRVKVQFHWDRLGKYNEQTSCWIRVAQNWAGKKWGALFLPRIGQEVIVDFLEGDPDQPIITGRVYNASSMPAYTLPDEMTKSYIKTNSSKGGGGFNELRFEDLQGKEQIFIHAQRNKDIRVENNLLEWVGKDSHLIVKHDQLEKVEGDKHQKVTGDKNEKVDGTVSMTIRTDHHEKVGSNYALEAGTEVHIKAGMKCIVEAGTQITLKVGGNFIDINPSGVTIKGTIVLINSGGSAGSGSGAKPEEPKDPTEADKAEAGEAEEQHQAKKDFTPGAFSPAALRMAQAAQTGMPFCEESGSE